MQYLTDWVGWKYCRLHVYINLSDRPVCSGCRRSGLVLLTPVDCEFVLIGRNYCSPYMSLRDFAIVCFSVAVTFLRGLIGNNNAVDFILSSIITSRICLID